MNNRLHGNVKVESLRNHSAADVAALERLLAAGADAATDPHHKNFYEVQGDGRVFYIYVSPVNAAVRLLAVWMPDAKPETVRMTAHAARAFCAA